MKLMEQQRPVVSIVLPSYNGEKYIRESIDSVLAQTFPDWELILVDDCSTDGTGAVMDAYAAKESRIKVIHNKSNQRLPQSLNIGFRKARGKYLTWTSDDNRYLPKAMKVMARVLDEDAAIPMVSCDMEYIDAEGRVIGKHPPYDDYLFWAADMVGACFMYRKEVLNIVGEYDPAKVYVEDYDYWLRIRSRMGKFKRIPEILYRYRRHGASLTVTKEREVRRQRAKLYLEYQGNILQTYQNDPKILCAVYYDFLMSGRTNIAFETALYDRLPELQHEMRDFPEEAPIFVFGAGEFGEKMAEFFGPRVVGFIDNDQAKIGGEKDGRPILSLGAYQKKGTGNAIVVVAVGMMNIYDIIHQILIEGIGEFCVYHRIVGMMDRERVQVEGL